MDRANYAFGRAHKIRCLNKQQSIKSRIFDSPDRRFDLNSNLPKLIDSEVKLCMYFLIMTSGMTFILVIIVLAKLFL